MQPPGGTVPHVPMATSQVVGTQQQFQTAMMGMPAVSQSLPTSQPQQPAPGLSGSLSSITVLSNLHEDWRK